MKKTAIIAYVNLQNTKTKRRRGAGDALFWYDRYRIMISRGCEGCNMRIPPLPRRPRRY